MQSQYLSVRASRNFLFRTAECTYRRTLGALRLLNWTGGMGYLKFVVIVLTTFGFMNFADGAETLWSDEFVDNELDSTLWAHHYPGERFSGFNDPSAVSVGDNNLTITTQFRDGKNFTGMVSTRGRKQVNSGYMEIRARLPVMRDGLKCSALLQSPLFGNVEKDPDLLPENTGSVVTIFQVSSTTSDRIYSAVNWGDFGDNSNRISSYTDIVLAEDQFNVFGINMLDDVYEFYLNGEKYLEVSEGISGVEMYLVLSCEVKDSLGVFDRQGESTQFDIDYVKFLDTRPIESLGLTGHLITEELWDIDGRSVISFGDHEDIGFERSHPASSKAMKVTLSEGSHLGADASYELPGNVAEAWVAYCVRFSQTWTTEVGGKLPGFAGNSAGWFGGGGQGGKPSDGTNAWSARMLYGKYDSANQSIPVGSYVYHTDQAGDYGSVDWWAPEPDRLVKQSAAFEHDKWYAVKQHIRINSQNNNDGVIEGWVNGDLVYSRTNFNFTNANRHRRIYRFWLDVYHGGGDTSPYDQHVYFDQFNYSVNEDHTSTDCR